MSIKRLSKRRLDIHVCELAKSSESNLPKLPPNARFYLRWKRSLQKKILVSVNHPLTRHFLRSYAAIAFEKRRHGRSSFWWVIHPCSDFRFYWDLLMMINFLYIFVTVPYILAFHRVAKSSAPKIWNPVNPAYIICVIDIVLNFITGFSSLDGHEIFLDPTLTIWHYLQGYFMIDFLSSIPYTWFYKDIILPPGPASNSILLIPEFLPLVKILRIYTLRFYIKQVTTTFALSHPEEMTIWLVLLTLLILHWCSCISHLLPFILAHTFGMTKEESEMYLITSGLYKKSDADIYLIYLHIGVSNFFGSSFTEFTTLGKVDTPTRSIILLLGRGPEPPLKSFVKGSILIPFCIVTVIVLQLVQSAVEPELKYQRILHRVKEFIHDQELPKRLGDKLIAYYEYRFQGSYFKEKAISNTLSRHLIQEIMINSSRGLLDTATILHSLPRHIIGNLMGIVKPVIYINEDIIYKCGDEGDCMFFIVSGTVALITFYGKEICHEKDGGYFGEGALIFPNRRRLETVIALEVCEFLRLSVRDFKRMFPSTSGFYKRLEKVANAREEQISKLNIIDEERIKSATALPKNIDNNQQTEAVETPANNENELQAGDTTNAE